MKSFNQLNLFILISLLVFSSCKKEFDQPPSDGSDPDIIATHSIAQLKALHTIGDPYSLITDDIIISGLVNADDKSGNFYKTLVIQDEVAGIAIRIEQSKLYTEFPVGRRVFVKCKGLYLGDYNGQYQLGGALDMTDPSDPELLGISPVMLDKVIIKGSYNNEVPAIPLRIDELSNDYQSMLIEIEDVEFVAAELGTTYADAVNSYSMNKTIEDCDGNTMIIRNSGYSDFAGIEIASGKGTLHAIMSIYGSDFQLLIRDTSDCAFRGLRCGAGPRNSLDENFEGLPSGDVTLAGWTNLSIEGSNVWKAKTADANGFVEATSFVASGSPVTTETWLITPPINFDVATDMQFTTAWFYDWHPGLSVAVSTNYDGTNATTASWNNVSAIFNSSTDAAGDFVSSGTINLSSYNGIGYVRFKFTGDAANTGNQRLDDVQIY